MHLLKNHQNPENAKLTLKESWVEEDNNEVHMNIKFALFCKYANTF